LRILNGSNARGYKLRVSDNRSFYVIASDGGLLASPVELKELQIFAGERFEMLVDGRDGRAFDVVALRSRRESCGCRRSTVRCHWSRSGRRRGWRGRLPSSLAVLPALPRRLPPVSQELAMNMFHDMRA